MLSFCILEVTCMPEGTVRGPTCYMQLYIYILTGRLAHNFDHNNLRSHLLQNGIILQTPIHIAPLDEPRPISCRINNVYNSLLA